MRNRSDGESRCVASTGRIEVRHEHSAAGQPSIVPDLPGVTAETHSITHHGGRQEALEQLFIIESEQIKALAGFLSGLNGIREGGEPLLDRTMVLFGSGMSYGHSHGNANLPTILAGGKGLGLKHGQHIDYNLPGIGKYNLSDAPKHYSLCHNPVNGKAHMTNLLLTMMQKMDVKTEQFADSLETISDVA